MAGCLGHNGHGCNKYKQKYDQKHAKHDTNGIAESGDPIQIGWEGWMAMEPEARIAPPGGNGDPLEIIKLIRMRTAN